MKRLIDANELSEKINNSTASKEVKITALAFVDTAPTVETMEVIMCKDCKHWKPLGSKAGNSFADMEYIGGCEFTNYSRRESDFCSYGERKDGDGNG